MSTSVSSMLAFCPASAPLAGQKRLSATAGPSCRLPAPLRLSGRRSAELRGTMKVRSMAAPPSTTTAKAEVVDGKMGKSLVVDRSYTYLDVRTPEEYAEEAVFRKPPIVNIPIGFMTDNGPTMNKDFLPEVAKKFPNKSARILVACDDEMDRANLAAKKLVQEGYTTVRVLNGGYPEWQKVKPLTEREKPKRG